MRRISFWQLRYLICMLWLGLCSLIAQTGTLWSPYLEWSVENSSYSGNPFDLIATVTFTHSGSGECHTTYMFYDSLDVWKFRFTGTRTGTWTYVSSSSDTDLDGLSGTVAIEDNPDVYVHGFLKKFGNKWGWEGTECAFVPQLVMFSNPYHLHPVDSAGKVEAGIQTFLVEHGFSGFHVGVACRWFAFRDMNSSVGLGEDPNPNIKMFESIENLIVKTHAAGGMVHLWMWADGNGTIDAWGKGSAVDLRLQQYIAARLGPLPGWSMGYGYDVMEWATEEEVHEWHDSMQSYLGWPHFLGARPTNPHTPESDTTHADLIPWNSGMDYSSYEHHRPTYDVYKEALGTISTQPVMSEDRFRIRVSAYPEKDYTELMTIQGLYFSTLAGGAANIWGKLLPAPGPGYSSVAYDSADCIKAYSEFFECRFEPDFIEDASITNGCCLRDPGNRDYIFYKRNTTSIQIDLSDAVGPRYAVIMNTLDPSEGEMELGWLEPVNQTIDLAPYGPATDWVMAVGFGCGLETSIFIEGAYDTLSGSMRCDLNSKGDLPLCSPYIEKPRSVESIPENVVDWVLVQLREAENGEAVYSRSSFLHKDGRIVADDGNTGRLFLEVYPGDYWLVIKHRNHLPVMSAETVTLE
jgi:hypothetical protein